MEPTICLISWQIGQAGLESSSGLSSAREKKVICVESLTGLGGGCTRPQLARSSASGTRDRQQITEASGALLPHLKKRDL